MKKKNEKKRKRETIIWGSHLKNNQMCYLAIDIQKYSTRGVLKYVDSSNVLKNDLWLSTYLYGSRIEYNPLQ